MVSHVKTIYGGEQLLLDFSLVREKCKEMQDLGQPALLLVGSISFVACEEYLAYHHQKNQKKNQRVRVLMAVIGSPARKKKKEKKAVTRSMGR